MLDLSKAFDRINFDILVNKLHKTDLPSMIVGLLEYMLRNTFVNVSFNGCGGNDWQVGNGARQGGILSPMLFNFYINEVIEMVLLKPVGCRLSGMSFNIICYADDIVLLSPFKVGLRILLDTVSTKLNEICLKLNIAKCSYMVFRRNKSEYNTVPVRLSGQPLVRVTECTYLGVVLSENLCVDKDVNRATNSFLKQFNFIYHKFNYVGAELLAFFFRNYTSSFYAIETWNFGLTLRCLRGIAVAYHKAVKRVCGMNVWESNHDACKIAGVSIFKHLYAKRRIKFLISIVRSRSPCLSHLRYYFRFNSFTAMATRKYFYDHYQIVDLFSNPLCALRARIDFVEKNEPSSGVM